MPLKYFGSLRFSDSEIPPAKAQRRQVRRGRKNILANDFHHFSPTFAALASLRETFRVSVAAVRRQANLFFPGQSGKKRVLLSLRISAACANFLPVCAPWKTGASDFLPPRRQARKGNSLFSDPRIGFPWRPLRLCARYSDSVAVPPEEPNFTTFRQFGR